MVALLLHSATTTMPGRPAKDAILAMDDDEIARAATSIGGLHIDDDEINTAFDFFDVDGTGKLTAAGMKQRLGAFYRNLPQKEIKQLLGDGTFTKESLKSLLQNNDLGAFDPTREAFKAYDPNNTGYVDTETLRSIFETLGYGEITDEDLQVLLETADMDGDGRVSLQDFEAMLGFTKGSTAEADAPAS